MLKKRSQLLKRILMTALAVVTITSSGCFTQYVHAEETPNAVAPADNVQPQGDTPSGTPKGEDPKGEKTKDDGDTTTPSAPVDTTPTTTNDFIMVGGDWVTPTATYGQYVNVVLPVVNMSVMNLNNVIVTPVIASNTEEWPFEITTSGYTQTIPDLPGRNNGQNDMDRRRELTWTFKTRADVLNGYYKLPFNVIYYNGDTYETCTLTTYVKVVGAPGSGNLSDGGSALSTPRVIVTGFTTDPETVHAGDTFTLTVHLKNTSSRTSVSNMQIDLTATEAGSDANSTYSTFLPTSGSNTLYVEKIGKNQTVDVSIELTAKSDLTQKPYPITMKMDYEDSDYNAFSASTNVSIPIKQEGRFELSSFEIAPTDIAVGTQTNVMFSIYNTGKTTMYNTQVKFEGDSIGGGDTFLGNIQAGGTGNVDAMVDGVAATMDDGTVKAVISYEDESGNVYTQEQEFSIYVYEEVYDDGDMMYDDMVYDEGGSSKGKIILIVVIVLVVLGGGITGLIFFLKHRKKVNAQKELEEGLEDENEEDLETDLFEEPVVEATAQAAETVADDIQIDLSILDTTNTDDIL